MPPKARDPKAIREGEHISRIDKAIREGEHVECVPQAPDGAVPPPNFYRPLNAREVEEMTGRGPMWIWREEAAGRIPPAV